MNRTLKSEDERKTKLFENWINYLRIFHFRFPETKFDDFFEGIATISGISEKRIDLKLEDGRALQHFVVSREISRLSCRLDSMYVVLGVRMGKWHVLDIISIGSILYGKQQQAHITFNPLLVGMHEKRFLT